MKKRSGSKQVPTGLLLKDAVADVKTFHLNDADPFDLVGRASTVGVSARHCDPALPVALRLDHRARWAPLHGAHRRIAAGADRVAPPCLLAGKLGSSSRADEQTPESQRADKHPKPGHCHGFQPRLREKQADPHPTGLAVVINTNAASDYFGRERQHSGQNGKRGVNADSAPPDLDSFQSHGATLSTPLIFCSLDSVSGVPRKEFGMPLWVGPTVHQV